MNDPARAFKVPSAMTKTPRNPPNPPDAPPRRSEAAETAEAAGNPFASLLSQQQGEAGGETKLYEVPRELIEIARARAANPKSSSGTLTPIAPRPNAELEATLAAYTAGLSATGRSPSSQPAARKEVETLRSQPAASQPAASHPAASHPAASQPAASQPAASQPAAGSPFAAYEESSTVVRRDAAARVSDSGRRGSAQPERQPLLKPALKPADSRKPVVAAGSSEPSERVTLTDPASAQQPLLRSPIAPRNSSAAPRSGSVTPRSGSVTPRSGPAAANSAPAPRSSSAAPGSKPASSAASQTLPWLVFVGLCLILGYCAHRFLLS